jgi:REP element-mobilizing transposase RayT
MARKKRLYKKNSYYHVFNRGNNKNNIFFDTEDKKYFLKNFYSYSKRYNIKIVAHCLMRNHFHSILKTGDCPRDLSKFLQAFMTKFSMYINRTYKRVGHVFQGRYKAKLITSKGYLIQVKKYIRNNPVKEGWVEDPDDYRWMRV